MHLASASKRQGVDRARGKTAPPKAVAVAQPTPTNLPKIVSLFCGAGGLDWGFHKEGFSIPLAIDISDAAIRTHNRNFLGTIGVASDLIKLGPAGVCKLVNAALAVKSRIGVIGGPPCQGFSRANTGAQADDPRNQLPQLYLDIVRRLKRTHTVEFVVFENVLGIRDKRHADTYKALMDGLDSLGFDVRQFSRQRLSTPHDRSRSQRQCCDRSGGNEKQRCAIPLGTTASRRPPRFPGKPAENGVAPGENPTHAVLRSPEWTRANLAETREHSQSARSVVGCCDEHAAHVCRRRERVPHDLEVHPT